uniref:Uncharacterized protein n=1 Tax=Anguilla anguilla TaxID=7936 RepID=A0A0E9VD38_ANGAN
MTGLHLFIITENMYYFSSLNIVPGNIRYVTMVIYQNRISTGEKTHISPGQI